MRYHEDKRLTVFLAAGKYGANIDGFIQARDKFNECKREQVVMGPQMLAPATARELQR
jgi:hypothetical protein